MTRERSRLPYCKNNSATEERTKRSHETIVSLGVIEISTVDEIFEEDQEN